MDRQPFPLGKLTDTSHEVRDLLLGLKSPGGIGLVLELKRIIRDEPMPVATQGSPMLARHLPRDADDPRPEPVRLAQARKVPVGPQETLLRQVARARRTSRDTINDGPHQPRIAVVETAERLAFTGPHPRHQLRISRFTLPQHHKTGGRRRKTFQSDRKE